MTVDYEHPLILEMKKVYRKGYEAYENFLRIGSLDGFSERFPKEVEKDKGLTLDALTVAKSIIPELIEDMRIATDLPEEDRVYYVPFMEDHLANIERWLREI